MKKNQVLSMALAAVFAVGMNACKKDEAELTADWMKHVEQVQKYSAKYPAFKAVFDQRQADAQKIFDEAKGLGDANARTAKITEANNTLNSLFPTFDAYEAAAKELKTATDKHATMPAALAKVSETAKAADAKASGAVAGAKATNVGEAKVAVEGATALLKDATAIFAGADAWVKASDEMKELLADKDLLNLPAAKVNPLMDAGKAAVAASAKTLETLDTANPGDVKAKLADATATLTKAIEPMKAAKPAPAVAAKDAGKDKPGAAHAPAKPAGKKK